MTDKGRTRRSPFSQPFRPRTPHENANYYGRPLDPDELEQWFTHLHDIRDGRRPKKLTLEDDHDE